MPGKVRVVEEVFACRIIGIVVRIVVVGPVVVNVVIVVVVVVFGVLSITFLVSVPNEQQPIRQSQSLCPRSHSTID